MRKVFTGLALVAMMQGALAAGDDFVSGPPDGDIGTEALSGMTIATKSEGRRYQQAFGGNSTACVCCIGNPGASTCQSQIEIGTTALFYDLMSLHFVWNSWETPSRDEAGNPLPIKRHNKDTVTIRNNGVTPLLVRSINTDTQNGWRVDSSRPVPFTLAPNASATVGVELTYKESWANDRRAALAVASPEYGFERLRGLRKAILTIVTNATVNPVNQIRVNGLWQYHAETAPFSQYRLADYNVYSEPSVYQIADVLGMSIRFSPQDDPARNRWYRFPSGRGSAGIRMDLGQFPGWFSQENRRGDEVISRLWTVADANQPVIMQPVTAFHTCCQPQGGNPWDQFSYFFFIDKDGNRISSFRQEHSAGQMVYPRVSFRGTQGDGLKGAIRMSRGDKFSMLIDRSYSDYTRNRNNPDFIWGTCPAQKGASNCGFFHRVFPAYNSRRQQIPNAYFVIVDNQPGMYFDVE
jgi:hypothetical protein